MSPLEPVPFKANPVPVFTSNSLPVVGPLEFPSGASADALLLLSPITKLLAVSCNLDTLIFALAGILAFVTLPSASSVPLIDPVTAIVGVAPAFSAARVTFPLEKSCPFGLLC